MKVRRNEIKGNVEHFTTVAEMTRQVKKAYLVMKENQEEEPSETILNQIDALVEGFEAHIEELREVLA